MCVKWVTPRILIKTYGSFRYRYYKRKEELQPCDRDRIDTFELFDGLMQKKENLQNKCGFAGKIYRRCIAKTLKRTVVAFHGGVNGEKRMLERLRIPCIDLCYLGINILYIDYFVYGKVFDGTIEADKLRQEETDLEADLIDWEGVE